MWATFQYKVTHYGLQIACELLWIIPLLINDCSGQVTERFWTHHWAYTVQQNDSKSTEVAAALGPDPGFGFHVHINLVSFLKDHHHPIGAIISEVGGSRVLSGANNSLTVLVQE